MTRENRIRTLIRKYIKGTSSRQEFKETINLLKKKEDSALNQEIEMILEEIWEEEEFTESPEEVKNNFSNMLKQIHRQIDSGESSLRNQGTVIKLKNIIKVAAILVLGIGIGLIATLLKRPEPQYITTFVPKGSINQLILPDSTIVYLNSGSELRYSLYEHGSEREVFLDGEAWFNVTENQKKSFIVHTPYYDVYVTGTKFNVKAYREDNEIVTTLEHGSVFIPSNERFKMKSGKFLLPGEQLIYNREKHSISKNKVEISIYSAWKENKLIFINMSLKELIIMLERKYGVDIEVSDTSIFKYHYDGTIRNESILEIMDLLQLTLPIQYEIVDNTVKIKRKEAQ